MMKLLKIVLIYSLTMQMAFADLCGFVFKPNPQNIISNDLKLIKKLNRLDNLTNKTRKLRTGSDATEEVLQLKKFREEFKLIEGELYKGDISVAVRKWRAVFRKTESSALAAENYAKMIKGVNKGIKLNVTDYDQFLRKEGIPKYLISEHLNALYKAGPEDYLKVLHKALRKKHRVLGNNFEKYNFIRKNLDDMVKASSCSPLCKQSVKALNEEIGIASQAERHLFLDLLQTRKSVERKVIQKIFNSHPESVVIARRKEFIVEAVGLLKKYVNSTKLLRKLYIYAGNSAAIKNLKLVRMFKGIFDKRAHGINKGIIDKVSHSTSLSPKSKLALIKSESKVSDYDGILVDFSRRGDLEAREAWQAMKTFAGKSDKNAFLLKQLNQAEELGIKIGKISNRKPRNLTTLISSLVVGGAFVGYFLFDTEDEAGTSPGDNPQGASSTITLISEDDTDEIIMLKYNSKLDGALLEELLSITDSLTQIEAKSSTRE